MTRKARRRTYRSLPALLRRAALAPALIATSVLLTTCAPMPDADDEGHATFAREAIKLLLGRPARGADEVEVVADIAKFYGRNVAAKMLMKETEFIDTWAENLVDILQMQREFGAGLPSQDGACWGAPTRASPDPAIATWVRDHSPTDGGAPPSWNMTDLIRSAIAIDDLSVVSRAYMFTLSMRRQGSNSPDDVTNRFMRVYLNRDLTCLRCHNPTFSASNKTDGSGTIVWQRTWTIPGHPEKALFGNYFDAATALAGLQKVMKGDVRKPAAAAGNPPVPFGIRPWNIAESCARDTTDGSPANAVVTSPGPPPSTTLTHQGFTAAPTATNAGAKFGAVDGTATPGRLFELEASFRSGVNELKNGYTRLPPGSPVLPPDQQQYCNIVQVFSSICVACHSGGSPAGGMDLGTNDPAGELINIDTSSGASVHAKRVVPGDAANSELWRRIDLGLMPPGGGLPAAQRPQFQNWINAGAPHTPNTDTCNTSTLAESDPDEALAFLTAQNLVDGIWMAAMGYRLTIDNGFSRNAQQRDMLWNLTEYTFLPGNWSLKAVLTKIMASNWYARRAPQISQGDAYELPPILNPWIVADPTQVSNPPAHQRFNGQGELVDRFRVNTLLRNVAAALAWKQPARFPDNNYPQPLAENLGQFISPVTPGFRGVNFQSLLALETQAGLCNKTGRAVGTDDWIDAVVDGITAFNTANPTAPLTMGEVWAMLKDRLFQDPSINATLPIGLSGVAGAKAEQEALVAFLGNGLTVPGGVMINTSSGAVSAAQLKTKLREGCGILVKSPQFMLTNVTPRTYSDNNMPGPPRLNVCMPGEPCGYPATCGHWRAVLIPMGHRIGCGDRTVFKQRWIIWWPIDIVAISKLDIDKKLVTREWPWLTRQSVVGIGSNIDLDRTAQPAPRAQPAPKLVPKGELAPKGGVVVGQPKGPPAGQPKAAAALDLIKAVRTAGSSDPAKGLDRVHQRLATLCPGTICGFVERPASEIERCLKSPKDDSCRAMHPLCDPRSQEGPLTCGALPADFSEAGVLAMWAEGAEVTEASGASILQADEGRWQPLRVGTKLNAGDLIFLPLRGSLRIEIDDVAFGDARMEEAEVSGVRGHMIAVSGPSSEKLLARPAKRGALSASDIARGVQSGAFNSRVMTRQDWEHARGYAILPQHQPTPTLKEINEINSNYDALHHGVPKDARRR